MENLRILIVSHGSIAQSMTETAKVLTHQSQLPLLTPIALGLNFTATEMKNLIEQELRSISKEENTLILSDIFGGSPMNICVPYIAEDKVEIITGMNLAMLLCIFEKWQQLSLRELCQAVKFRSEEAIQIVGQYLG